MQLYLNFIWPEIIIQFINSNYHISYKMVPAEPHILNYIILMKKKINKNIGLMDRTTT